MTNLALLLVCFTLGLLLRRTGRFPAETPAALNAFVIHVSLPALTLVHIHTMRFDPRLLFSAAMAWVLFALGVVFFRLAGRWAGLPAGTIGALMLVGGLGNTSFVGLPMIEAFYGKDMVGVGIICDQLGSFLVLSTLGIVTATIYSDGGVNWARMPGRVLRFPPFQAVLLALLVRPLPFPDWLPPLLHKLGDTLTPLTLTSVGFQLRLGHIKNELAPLGLGLFYKLLLGPALITLLFAGLLGGRGQVMQVTLFEAAMAPMITGGIIAMEHGLNPPLVTLMLGLGIPLSFLTLSGWWWLLRGL